ncbi:MAG TPA: ATP-binding protein [Anaerolineales bacterium]|nr:ATP-binding protein [Anaerolineales bacterium]
MMGDIGMDGIMPDDYLYRTRLDGMMDTSWRTLAEFDLPSEPGNEKIAMARVASLIKPFKLPDAQVERIKTAVAEATMNAMEHGNHFQAEVPVQISLAASKTKLQLQIEDHGKGPRRKDPEIPDLEAKLAGLQSPRGWGLYLIRSMVDELNVTTGDGFHRLELIFNLI